MSGQTTKQLVESLIQRGQIKIVNGANIDELIRDKTRSYNRAYMRQYRENNRDYYEEELRRNNLRKQNNRHGLQDGAGI